MTRTRGETHLWMLKCLCSLTSKLCHIHPSCAREAEFVNRCVHFCNYKATNCIQQLEHLNPDTANIRDFALVAYMPLALAESHNY